MAYQSILVHADLSRHAPQRIAIAARLAHAHQAHLIGAAMTGVSRFTLENNRGMRGGADQRPARAGGAGARPV
ncbi:hypothetical protein [Janthinobacterium sp. LB2P70]|uniref:hypothetical protein n=1 Tax=Janthinobacterium sp. LB2P70 TaxID=3424197 RepID=UPI003F1FEB81